MKIGVLSDTHIPSVAPCLPPAVFDHFAGVDLILHAGDINDLAILDELRVIAPVEAVAGNTDGPEAHRLLPSRKVLTLGRFQVGLVHGKYRLDEQHRRIRQEFNKTDLIVYGHSHEPFWGSIDGMLFLNPGSPTDNRHAPYHSIAILEIGDELNARIVRV